MNSIVAMAGGLATSAAWKGLFRRGHTVEFVLHLPRPMTLAEFNAEKRRYENHELVSQMLGRFRDAGKILSTRFSFSSRASRWVIEFRDEAAYLEWMNLPERERMYRKETRYRDGYRLQILS